ncbi:MAG TPA: fluoride efflux transporter CrcB [Actinomycetales bacterium]|nr:fluoride efflux transporter CrcB [Actinomycetales bacterium]
MVERPPATTRPSDEDARSRTSPSLDVHALPLDSDVEPADRVEPLRLTHLVQPVRRVVAERPDVLALIALGGALGALARWGTSVAWPTPVGTFPWATVEVNVLGCLLIGLLMVVVRRRGREGRYTRPFLGVGVLGGYTTFSTYALDVHSLLLAHRPGLAATYLVGTVVVGLVAVWCGVQAGQLAVRATTRSARA